MTRTQRRSVDGCSLWLENFEMLNRHEGTFAGHENAEIFYQTWTISDPRGTLILTHGLAEHSECYHALAKRLNQEKWNVWAWDLRGHGRSEGKRGCVGQFSDFMKDLGRFVEFYRTQKDLPITKKQVLFGHSLGGQITTRAILEGDVADVDAVVLSSPAFGLKKTVPAWKTKFAQLAAEWLPNMTLSNEITWRELSRDEEQIKTYDQDPMRHDRISPVVYLGMCEGFERVAQHASEFQTPLCVQIGGLDPMIDGSASRAFFEATTSKVKQLFIYPDSLHEIYNDLDRDSVFNDLKGFLAKV